MLGPLAFIAVRQKHHETVCTEPFAFAACDELINHYLRAVGEVAELALPQHQRFGISPSIAIFKTKHAELR